MIGSVDPGPLVSSRCDACEVAELMGEMWLVAVAVPGGNSCPADPGLAVELARSGIFGVHAHARLALGRRLLRDLGFLAAVRGLRAVRLGIHEVLDRPGAGIPGGRDRAFIGRARRLLRRHIREEALRR